MKPTRTNEVTLRVDANNLHLHVEEYAAAPAPWTKVYEGGDFLLRVDGCGWADSQLAAIIGVHYRARDLGHASGRDAYKLDLLRFLGAQPLKDSDS